MMALTPLERRGLRLVIREALEIPRNGPGRLLEWFLDHPDRFWPYEAMADRDGSPTTVSNIKRQLIFLRGYLRDVGFGEDTIVIEAGVGASMSRRAAEAVTAWLVRYAACDHSIPIRSAA